jgi:hypothetical protein
MRRLLFGTLLALTIVLSVPAAAQAADAGFYGPIISTECRCPGTQAPGWGCVLETIRVLMNFGITIAGIIAVLIIAHAGFLFVGSTANPEMRSQARNVLINAIVGMVIVLAAWLVVDFIMTRLYNPGAFGPWNSILYGNEGQKCIQATTVAPLTSGPGITAQPGVSTVPQGPGGITGAPFAYQTAAVALQAPAVSGALSSLLSCMASKVPGGAGKISALTDSYSTTDAARIAHCAAVGSEGDSRCAHTVHSAHYGGYSCVGQSYAVDFGDQENASALITAANACGAPRAALENGNHVHVSAPNHCGQNGSASN